MRTYDPEELLVQFIPVGELPPEQVALAYCRQVASTRGSAVVVGDKLLVKDIWGNLERLRLLLEHLREQPPASSREQPAPQ